MRNARYEIRDAGYEMHDTGWESCIVHPASGSYGVTVMEAAWLTPEALPVTVMGGLTVTVLVSRLTFRLVRPAGTVTLFGTVSVVLLLTREITLPPGPAAPVSVILRVVVLPPLALVALKPKEFSSAAVTVIAADLLTLP